MTPDNDVQFIPSNNLVQIDQPKSGAEMHSPLPPPNYGQIYTQTMQSPNNNPTVPAYMYHNGQIIALSYVNNGTNGPYPVAKYPVKRRDYFNIVWSGFNILCCGLLLGFVALGISIIALRMRRDNNHQSVRCFTIWATITNAIATIAGITIIIIFSISYYQ